MICHFRASGVKRGLFADLARGNCLCVRGGFFCTQCGLGGGGGVYFFVKKMDIKGRQKSLSLTRRSNMYHTDLVLSVSI